MRPEAVHRAHGNFRAAAINNIRPLGHDMENLETSPPENGCTFTKSVNMYFASFIGANHPAYYSSITHCAPIDAQIVGKPGTVFAWSEREHHLITHVDDEEVLNLKMATGSDQAAYPVLHAPCSL